MVAQIMGNSSAIEDKSLETYLEQVGRLFDVPQIINEKLEKPQIVRYFVANRISQLVWSWEGFFHYGLSCDGKYQKDDLTGQARLVERYVHDISARNVLELACGLGANSAFLARRNPNITFDAIDIVTKPLRRYAILPNLHFQFGDYGNLGQFQDNSFDLVFVIEGLCHSTNKLQVLHEAKKKLRKGGIFVVVDGYQRDRAEPLNLSERLMWRLIEKSLSCDKIERVLDVEGYMQKEYSIAEREDRSPFVLPSIARFERIVRFYFSHPVSARAVNAVVPFDIMKNTIHLLLLPISVRRQIGCYYVHVLQKG
jgi:ubiquinone/menaquinone biosynthesis C-methylase UbiE